MNDAESTTRPNADEVARRMLCLDMVQHRRDAEEAFLLSPTEEELDDIEGNVEAMLSFLRESGLWEFLSNREIQAFEAPVGGWKDPQFIEATWRLESLAVICWALGMIELPEPHTQIDPDDVARVLDIDQWHSVVAGASLRDAAEIDRAREVAALWDWRASVGIPPYADDQDETEIAEEVRAAFENGLVSTVMDGDLVVRGRPFFDLDEEELEEVASIAFERHYALNWLCGYSEDWDDVPTDE